MNIKNWALFIESDHVKWSFGLNKLNKKELVDETTNEIFLGEENEFQKTTVNFIQSLQAIGRELYSEGVASIKLENPTKSTLAVNEIFIVNLSDQFFFIISDLPVTTRLIDLTNIPFEVEQIICAVLVGQAAILYSTLVIDQSKFNFDIDDVYKNILKQIEVDKRYDLTDLVDKGRCSLSPLKMTELLLFHYLLRNFLEQNFLKTSSNAWAIMVDKNGTDIPLSYLPPKDPYLLGNFLGVIYSYVQGLFGVQPSAIVFGGTELIFLQFFSSGGNFFLAASNPNLLVRDKTFLKLLKKVPEKKLLDILNIVKQFIIELTLNELGIVLQKTEFFTLAKLQLQNKKITISNYALTDIQGLGKKSKKMLNKMGIFTPMDLLEFDLSLNKKQIEKTALLSVKKIQEWKEDAKKLLENTFIHTMNLKEE